MDPEGKLLMGFRKASIVNSTQVTSTWGFHLITLAAYGI